MDDLIDTYVTARESNKRQQQFIEDIQWVVRKAVDVTMQRVSSFQHHRAQDIVCSLIERGVIELTQYAPNVYITTDIETMSWNVLVIAREPDSREAVRIWTKVDL